MSLHVPSVLYFYGLSGAGKNYVGDIAGNMTGAVVYHADIDLTEELKKAIIEKKPFTDAMRDPYYAIVADHILRLQEDYSQVIVSQATYKMRHRDYLLSKIPDMEMICVTASVEMIIERLENRGDAITPDYAARMSLDFDPVAPGSKTILNDAGENEVVMQLMELYPDLRLVRQRDKIAAA